MWSKITPEDLKISLAFKVLSDVYVKSLSFYIIAVRVCESHIPVVWSVY